MKQVWELDAQSFEKMLEWLDKDRDIAAQKYEAIRDRIIKILDYRGCLDSESLADETIDRVTRKIDAVTESYEGDPLHYFLNVAIKIHLEYQRRPVAVELPANFVEMTDTSLTDDDEDFQPQYECLKKCLAKLPASKRAFILEYYQENKQKKLDALQKIAESEGIEIGTLHTRAFRLRESLQKCVSKCVGKKE